MIRPRRTVKPSGKRWKLWHLTLAVLVSALAFGAIRALGQASSQALLLLPFAWLAGIVFVWSISLGVKLGDRATRDLMDRALDRGGVIGFCLFVFGIGVNVAFMLGAMVFAATFLFAGLAWLFRLGEF